MENNNDENAVTNNEAIKAENVTQNAKVNNATSAEAPKKKFGVSKDTQSSSGLPIPAPYRAERSNQFPNKHVFPIAKLVKVHFDPNKAIKQETEHTPALTFVFVASGTPKKQFTHVEFPIDDTDPKFEAKQGWMMGRIKHFFDETVGAKNFVDGSMEGDSFAELFENIAKAFNNVTYLEGTEEEGKRLPVYTKVPVYIKLVYNKSRLQFGLFPNLIQRAMKGAEFVPCELLIDAKYDTIDPQVSAPISAGGGSMTGANFGAADNDDFPDV